MRRASRKYVSVSPIPFTSMLPRRSHT
jgi:hypothetical protein